VRIKKVAINRAPVMTLWVTVVAERVGYDYETALTLGKGVAGLNAQSKGRRLGIFEEQKEVKEEREQIEIQSGGQFMVNVLGRLMPAITTDEGIRATIKGKPIDPDSVRRYLENKFGNALADIQEAMEELAKAYNPDTLGAKAHSL
jgi:hypothetical protein